ncbi:JAB domain-containing protein [Sphingobacterium corticis]|uniref:JAB domain-containing protein n=1 Tax=Sphingobacterium corticis TaxID=1812823 RepID=A0ABW5NLX5_9SPHI
MSTQSKTTDLKTLSPVYANELMLTYHQSAMLEDGTFKHVNSPYKVSQVLRKIWNAADLVIRESFYLLCFSNAADLIGYFKVADGGIDSVMVDTRLIFSAALLCRASSIIVAHNHPSGTLKPSEADHSITARIKAGADLLGITVNDHIILTENHFYSFNEHGDL